MLKKKKCKNVRINIQSIPAVFFFFKNAYKIRKRVNTFKNISRLRRNLLLTLLKK